MKTIAKTPWKALLVGSLLALIAGFNGAFIWQMFYQPPWLTYENLPFPTAGDARLGEILPLMVRRCNNDSVPHVYELSHSLERVDTTTPMFYLLESQTVRIEPGCATVQSMANRLPKALPPGKYRFFGAAEIPSGLRSYRVEWHSVVFEVKQ